MLVFEIKSEAPCCSIQWLSTGDMLHKYRSLAVTNWHTNGQKYSEGYWVNGGLSRDPSEGPAYTLWHTNGQKRYEEYRVNGERHRDPILGPAVTAWYKIGQKDYEEYYLNGERVDNKGILC